MLAAGDEECQALLRDWMPYSICRVALRHPRVKIDMDKFRKEGYYWEDGD